MMPVLEQVVWIMPRVGIIGVPHFPPAREFPGFEPRTEVRKNGAVSALAAVHAEGFVAGGFSLGHGCSARPGRQRKGEQESEQTFWMADHRGHPRWSEVLMRNACAFIF